MNEKLPVQIDGKFSGVVIDHGQRIERVCLIPGKVLNLITTKKGADGPVYYLVQPRRWWHRFFKKYNPPQGHF